MNKDPKTQSELVPVQKSRETRGLRERNFTLLTDLLGLGKSETLGIKLS